MNFHITFIYLYLFVFFLFITLPVAQDRACGTYEGEQICIQDFERKT